MVKVLLIEDETIFHRMIEHSLQPLGYTVHSEVTGFGGLAAAARMQPDVIITDLALPDISGYEVTRRLRRDPSFAQTPIIVLTGQTGLQDKLNSFEAGADDHITKPFEPVELVARMNVLLRRMELVKKSTPAALPVQPVKITRMFAVHTLRGGVGSSTLAVNLALGFQGLWACQTALLDLVLTAGQVALLLNMPLKRTWADLSNYQPEELDFEIIQSIMAHHPSGLDFIAAPTYPTDAEMLSEESLKGALRVMRPVYDYIIADLPHDFSEVSLLTLDAADIILLVIAPELSSIRAAAAALDTYNRLGYPPEKIKLVLNHIFPHQGLPRERIEQALNKQVTITLPYTPDLMVQAINLGRPILSQSPEEPIAMLMEDFAFYLSLDHHKKTRPEKPTQAWKRIYERFLRSRNRGQKK